MRYVEIAARSSQTSLPERVCCFDYAGVKVVTFERRVTRVRLFIYHTSRDRLVFNEQIITKRM